MRCRSRRTLAGDNVINLFDTVMKGRTLEGKWKLIAFILFLREMKEKIKQAEVYSPISNLSLRYWIKNSKFSYHFLFRILCL